MGAISKERLRVQGANLDTSVQSLQALQKVQSLASKRKEEENDKILMRAKSLQIPGSLAYAFSRVMHMSNPDSPFTSAISALGLAGRAPSAITGAHSQRSAIDKWKIKKDAVDSGSVREGGIGQIASNVAGVGALGSKIGAGAFTLGMASDLLGFGGAAKTLKTVGSTVFQNNPVALGSFMAKRAGEAKSQALVQAGEKALSNTYSPAAIPQYLATKTGTAVAGLGDHLTNFGFKGAGGLVHGAGSGLQHIGDMLGGLDGGIAGSLIGVLSMLGLGIGGQKITKKIANFGGANKMLNTGRQIRATIPNGLKEADKYFLGRSAENIHNLYTASGAYGSPYEALSNTLALLQLKAVSILPAIYEVLVGKGEQNRVGGNLNQNAHQVRFGFGKSKSSFDDVYRDLTSTELGFGNKLNKIGVGIEGTLLKASAIMNPMNWLSIKNNPLSLLMAMKQDKSLDKAYKSTAKSFNMSLSHVKVLNENFAKSVQAGETVEEKLLLAVMHIGEIIRLEALSKTRNGRSLMGAMSKRFTSEKLKNETIGEMVDNIAEAVGHIPIIGPLVGLSMVGTKALTKLGPGSAKLVKGMWDAFTGKKLEDQSKVGFSIAQSKSPQELMALYLGKTFPERFEKLLDKAVDRNNFIKEIAKKLKVDDKYLTDTTSGNKWITETGQMMSAAKLDKYLKRLSKSSSRKRFTELMSGFSWYSQLLRGDNARRNIAEQSENEATSIFAKYFSGGTTNTRSADASQQRVIQERLDKEKIKRDKRKTSLLANIDKNIVKLMKCCKSGGFGTDTGSGDDDSGLGAGVLTGLAGLLGLPLLWRKLKVLSKKYFRKGVRATKKGFKGLKTLGKMLPVFKMLGGAFTLFEVIYYWDDITDWVGKKVNNLMNGDIKQLFGLEDESGKDIAKSTWGFGGDASKTLWHITSTAALLFPNPFTLGLAAAVGVWRYGDKIFDYGKEALEWLGLKDSDAEKIRKEKEVKRNVEQSKKEQRTYEATTALKLANHIVNNKDNPYADGPDIAIKSVKFKKVKDVKNIEANLIDYSQTGTKNQFEYGFGKIDYAKASPNWPKLFLKLQEASDINKSGNMDSGEEFKKAAEELMKNTALMQEFVSLNVEGQKALLNQLNMVGAQFQQGQIIVANAVEKANNQNSTSFSNTSPATPGTSNF